MDIQNYGYIFLCSTSTEDECLQRMLFGGTEKYQSEVRNVKTGDTLFLYNYMSKRLHGTFKATSDSQLHIEPNAWKGKYPWQVKVTWDKKYQPLTRTDFENVISFRKDFPLSRLTEGQIATLEQMFASSERLPHQEEEFREKFPAKYFTDDGHKVRSNGELTIDNWLFNQEILHRYERKIPIEEIVYCDFFIPITGQKERIYIEYWGREDEAYNARKEYKIKLYEKYQLKLIQLIPEDLEKIDDVLPKKLHHYLPNLKFY